MSPFLELYIVKYRQKKNSNIDIFVGNKIIY